MQRCFFWLELGHLRSSHSFSLCAQPLLLTTSLQNKLGLCGPDSQAGDKPSPSTDRAPCLTPPLCPLPVIQINQLEEHWEYCSSARQEYPSESLSPLPSAVLMFLILRAQSRNCHLILHSLPWRFRGATSLTAPVLKWNSITLNHCLT